MVQAPESCWEWYLFYIAFAIINFCSLFRVPTNLLKAKFPEASKLFISLLEKYADGRGSLIMAVSMIFMT